MKLAEDIRTIFLSQTVDDNIKWIENMEKQIISLGDECEKLHQYKMKASEERARKRLLINILHCNCTESEDMINIYKTEWKERQLNAR